MTGAKKFSLWTKPGSGGERKLRTSSKFLLTVLPFLLSGLLFQALVMFEKIDGGSEVIENLAYGIIVLVVAMSLLTLIISLIDYLRSME
jgi:hypothetical protein